MSMASDGWQLVEPRPAWRESGAGSHATPLGAYLTYANVTRERNERPLTLDAWRERETHRNTKQREHLAMQRDDATTRRHGEWKLELPLIADTRPTPRRFAWRRKYRAALLPVAYRGTLLRDGLSLDATTTTYRRAPYDVASPLSYLIEYSATDRAYFRTVAVRSAHGARIAAMLPSYIFCTTPPVFDEGR